MSIQQRQPLISFSAVAAAGFASATAAVVTSRFGIAGTLLGAALTSMIITGGSAILKAYLERVSGQVRAVPEKVRTKAVRQREPAPDGKSTIPGRPDLRDNFVGRLRASLGWFSRLPSFKRRPVLIAAVVPALIAFGIAASAVTAMEVSVGTPLSCAIWNKCPAGYTGANAPGIGLSILGGNRIVGANAPQPPQDGQQDVQSPSEAQPVDPAPLPEPAPQPVTLPSNYGTTPLEPTIPEATVTGVPGQ